MSPDYPFTEEGIQQNAPIDGGVYLIHSDSEWVYAGQASNLDRRLKEHFRGTSDQSRCIHRHDAKFFRYEVIAGDRDDREEELINRYKPKCND